MAVKMSWERLVRIVYSKLSTTTVGKSGLSQLQMKNLTFLPSKKIFFTFNTDGDGAYTRVQGRSRDNFRICFGGRLVKEAAHIPNKMTSVKKANEYGREAQKAFLALYYHEIGHLIFTDMFDRRMIEYENVKYKSKIETVRYFFHSLHNIIEDVTMERYGMSASFPYTAKYFDYLKKNIFITGMSKYEDDGNSMQCFLNFLLNKLRCGKLFTGTNKIWAAHSKDLVPMVKGILLEPDGTERITKCIALGEWMLENTMIEIPDDPPAFEGDTVADPKGSTGGAGGSPTKTSGGAREGKGGGGKGGAGDGATGSTGASEGGDGEHEDVESPKTKDELDELEEDASEAVSSSYDPAGDVKIEDLPEVDDSFNDVLGSADNHMWISAKACFDPNSTVEEEIDKRLTEMMPLSIQCKKALSLFKDRHRPRFNRGYLSGKLDLRAAMTNSLTNGCNTKLFKKKIKNGETPDLAVSILCDNSGSMGGNKSRVCTTAMLALAQACEMCKIPLEINAFTANGDFSGCTCYTIHMKDIGESLKQSKPYLGITDTDILRGYRFDRNNIPTFAGNSDEVNLYYVWKNFKRDKHKDKLIIVISDGMTCGNSGTLRNVVDKISRDGISIIGLGIQSTAVRNIYTKDRGSEYRLFDSEESLNSLPEFLTTTLLAYAKGGK